MYKKLLLLGAISMLFSSCVTDPNTNQKKPRKAALGTAAGAALGSIAGKVFLDKKNSARDGALIGAAIGLGVGAYMDHQEKVLRDKLKDTDIEVTRNDDNIKLSMPNDITFATNSAYLNDNVVTSLRNISQVFNEYKETKINITGHADSSGNDKINIPLSQRRAKAVADFLISNGVDASRLTTSGVGSSQPRATNSTIEGRAQNRRVEINVIPNTDAVNSQQTINKNN